MTPRVQDLLNFTDRVVVITGASKGVGAGIASRFSQAGANLVINYRRSRDQASALVAAIEERGGSAIAVAGDVTERAQVEGLCETTVSTFGHIDTWVNNAGVYPLHNLMEMKDDAWRDVIDANLYGVHLGTQIAGRQMIDQGSGGSIVNVASIEAHTPGDAHAHYAPAKAAVLMHTRSAAKELGPHGVRVNSVSPGLVWRDGIEQ